MTRVLPVCTLEYQNMFHGLRTSFGQKAKSTMQINRIYFDLCIVVCIINQNFSSLNPLIIYISLVILIDD